MPAVLKHLHLLFEFRETTIKKRIEFLTDTNNKNNKKKQTSEQSPTQKLKSRYSIIYSLIFSCGFFFCSNVSIFIRNLIYYSFCVSMFNNLNKNFHFKVLFGLTLFCVRLTFIQAGPFFTNFPQPFTDCFILCFFRYLFFSAITAKYTIKIEAMSKQTLNQFDFFAK